MILNFRLIHYTSAPGGAPSIPEKEKGGGWIGTPLVPVIPHVCIPILAVHVHTAYRFMSIPLVFPSASDFTKLLFHSLFPSLPQGCQMATAE